MGKPEETASAAVFLASHESGSFVGNSEVSLPRQESSVDGWPSADKNQ